MTKIEINKKGKKGESSHDLSQNGPQVNDIKINTNHSSGHQKHIHSRVIEIKEEKDIVKKQTKRKNKKVLAFSLIALGAAFVILLAFFSLNFLLNRDTLAKYVPAEAKLYLHINVNALLAPNSDFNFLVAKFVKPEVFKSELEKSINNRALAQYKLDFIRDIKPVLSSEAGLLFLEGATKNSSVPVVLVKTKNGFQLQNLLNNMQGIKSVKERSLAVTKIKSVIFEKASSNFSAAQIGNIIFLSREPEAIEQCAFAKQKKNNFSSRANSLKNIFRLDKEKLAQVYINKKTANILSSFWDNGFAKNVLENAENVRIEFATKRDGVKFYFDGEGAAKKEKKSSLKVASFLPKNTILSFWGNDLNAEFNTNHEAGYLADFSKEIAQYGASADKFFAGFSGEFGFSVLPKKNSKPTYVFVSEIKDREKFNKSEENLEKIIVAYFSKTNPKEKSFELADGTEAVELVPNKDAVKFTEKDIEGIKVKNFKDEKTNTQVNLAQAGEIFMLTLGPMEFNKIFIGESFSVTDNFKELYKKISGQRKSEMVYLDVKNVLGFFGKSQVPQDFWQAAKILMLGLKNGQGEGYLKIDNE